FPRNQAQTDALDELLTELDRDLDAILFFDLDDEIAQARILGRAAQEGRADDTAEVIANRLAIYRENTAPVIGHYRASGKRVPLHAARTPDEVWREIEEALDQVGARA